jgi:hypothetical protein
MTFASGSKKWLAKWISLRTEAVRGFVPHLRPGFVPHRLRC